MPRPPCPDGHKGKVWLSGAYRSKRIGFERPRYICVPADGSKPHKFTPSFSPRRPIDHVHDEHECALCERQYGRGEARS